LNNNLVMFLQVKYFIEKFKLNSLRFVFFLAVIEDETLSDVYDHICEVIDHEQSRDHVWIPSKEKL